MINTLYIIIFIHQNMLLLMLLLLYFRIKINTEKNTYVLAFQYPNYNNFIIC